MKPQDRQIILKQLHTQELEIAQSKGAAYAGNGDVLENFKRNAKALGLSPYQIWAVYFNKHMDAINNAIKATPDQPVDHSEGLQGRILDARTYLGLLSCLLQEGNINAGS